MSFSVNQNIITPPGYTPVDQSSETSQTQETQRNGSTTLTVLDGVNGTSGSSGANAPSLTNPMLGPEDIHLNEFAQQLEGLDAGTFTAATLMGSMNILTDNVKLMADQIANGGEAFVKENAEALGQFFGQVEEQAKEMESTLYDLISNSRYPSFNDFMKEMLAVSQELRKLASEAKHAAIMGEYDNLLDQSKAMKKVADHNYKAALKEADAQIAKSIGQIISGALSLAGAVAGMKFSGPAAPGSTLAATRFASAQGGASMGGAVGGIAEGVTGIIAAQYSKDAAVEKHKAEMFQAAIKSMEAGRTLMQEAQQVAGELSDIAKELRDMVLKLYQDFISSQSQIIQRANI